MHLYRFEKPEDRRIDTIRRGSLWCAAPSTFDDVADCRLTLSDEGVPQWATDEVLAVADKIAKSSPIGETAATHLIASLRNRRGLDDELEEMIASSLDEDVIREHIRETTAVCCFFENKPENALMWSHYAEGHNGFCVEYRLERELADMERSFFPVNYSTCPITVSLAELLLSPTTATETITTNKGALWAYESEWRLVKPNDLRGDLQGIGHEVQCPKSIRPTAIIVGYKMTRENRAKLRDLTSSLKIPIREVIAEDGELSIVD